MEYDFDPEGLRPLECVFEPDPRNLMFALVDKSGSARPMELADRYAEISECSLHKGVPEEVAIQFETVKNLYLFSWFVYRFFSVAEHNAYACLELALRERFKTEIRTGQFRSNRPTLRPLLRYAADKELIRNEGFATWRNRGRINSRHRADIEALRRMREKQLETTVVDYSSVQITEEDLEWNYVEDLINVLPALRNEYAHGSANLHSMSLRAIKTVAEIVNQLFETPAPVLPE